ncbi:MAG: hypothetical protein KZQ85_14555 [Candidatus Thiodiazotropha sp. (ex Myrtea sp. 'scaly one' KF741663)]|nr:hypothetical protein [Candidatus Thiodiazotropha sp. (ex Myrtea sp. 'scaly one' KF741663)]
MDYLEIVFDHYNENRQQARDQFNLPAWLTRFWIDSKWKNADEHTEIDPNLSSVVIEMRYAHEGGRCYQIREYCVYDQKITIRTGTLCLFLRVDVNGLRQAEQFAIRFLYDATLNALANYHNPTSGVVAGLVDIGLMAAESVILPVLGDIFSAADMAELLGSIQEITDKVEARLREIRRLIGLDGSKLAEYPNVRHPYRWESVKSFSSVEIVEVECADWILEIPEGEVIRIPEHDERLYPTIPLSDDLDRSFRSLRERGFPAGADAVGSLRQAKQLVNSLRAEQEQQRKR